MEEFECAVTRHLKIMSSNHCINLKQIMKMNKKPGNLILEEYIKKKKDEVAQNWYSDPMSSIFSSLSVWLRGQSRIAIYISPSMTLNGLFKLCISFRFFIPLEILVHVNIFFWAEISRGQILYYPASSYLTNHPSTYTCTLSSSLFCSN